MAHRLIGDLVLLGSMIVVRCLGTEFDQFLDIQMSRNTAPQSASMYETTDNTLSCTIP